MGACASVIVLDASEYIEYLKKAYPNINTTKILKSYTDFTKIGMLNMIKSDLVKENYIDENDMLTTGTKPFNVFARLAMELIPNIADQSVLGEHQHSFVVCHNKPENDARWDDDSFATASMAGPDDNGPGHVFLTTRNLHWSYFNVISIVIHKRYEFLLRMKAAALLYSESRGWNNPGFYFHCFPHNSVKSLHLHIVNLDNIGFQYWNCVHKNLSIDHAIEVALLHSTAPPYIDV